MADPREIAPEQTGNSAAARDAIDCVAWAGHPRLGDHLKLATRPGHETTGPWKDIEYLGNHIGAMGGLYHLTGCPDRLPIGPCVAFADYTFSPFHAATALLAALRYRNLTGKGQLIDLSQYEATAAALGHFLLDAAANNRSLGVRDLPPQVFESTLVSLEPIRNGTFSYQGDHQVRSVKLVEAELQMGLWERVKLAAPDVLEMLQRQLPPLRLSAGTLRSVKLRFRLHAQGASGRPQTVLLKPPHRTDLNRRRDTEIIEGYLRRQGVLLA